MPRINTTPRRPRSDAHRRSLPLRAGVSPTAIKKLRVDMLRGYLSSYKLPTSGSKQQLVERLTHHIRSSATKKIQRPRGQPSKQKSVEKAATHTGTEAPPLDSTPPESSDSNSDNDNTGSQDPPSGDQGSPQRPPSGGPKTKRHRAQSSLPQSKREKHRRYRSMPSDADSHSGGQSSPPSGGQNPRARKRHASCSHSPPSKRQRYRRPHSTSSESDLSAPWYRRHGHRDSSLSSSSTSSYTSSSSSSSSSRHRHRHQRRRHCSRRRRRHSSSATGIASISCAPPLPGHLQNRIKRGKYVNFDKLLIPPHTPPLSMFNQKSAKKRNTEKRQVVDLNSWLEAWNRYATCRIASDPAMALELVKYQTVVSLLFARYPAASVIEYDCLFRQAAARDRTMRWDSPKEDIYVWALTHPSPTSSSLVPHPSTGYIPSCGTSSSLSFRDRVPIAARLGPPVKPHTPTVDRATHTSNGKEICKRFNFGRCTKGEDCIFAHTCWHSNCQGDHPGKACPKRS